MIEPHEKSMVSEPCNCNKNESNRLVWHESSRLILGLLDATPRYFIRNMQTRVRTSTISNSALFENFQLHSKTNSCGVPFYVPSHGQC